MSDYYFSGSYPHPSQPYYTKNYARKTSNQNQYVKPGSNRNSYDIKASNISQQTIINKARLYSPERSQQLVRNNFSNDQYSGRTKAKKSQITEKIHEIVDLCEIDRDADTQQFQDVIVAEKRILNMLQQSENQKGSVPAIDLSNFADPHHDRGTTFGPIRNQNYDVQKIQSRQLTRREAPNERPTATAARENIYKKSAIDDLKTDRNLEEPLPNLPAQIRQIAQQNKSMNDETEKMIEQIEKKAMEEIEGLRSDKIQLMKRLNSQIKAHNEQKKIRMALQNQLAALKGLPIPNIPNRVPTQSNSQIPPAMINSKSEQKFYSQPHFKQIKQRNPAPHYHPYQSPPVHYERHDANPLLQSLRVPVTHRGNNPGRQYLQVQDENNMLRSVPSQQPRNYQKSVQKESLKRQVSQLNNLIGQYESQFQRIRFEGNSTGLRQLQNLLEEGQKIDQEALRLLRKNKDGSERGFRIPSSNINQEIVQETNNFKKRLIEAENQRLKNGSSKEKATYEKPANSKQNNSSYSNRMMEFERILSDMNNAAR